MVSCFSWFLRDTHTCLLPRSPGDQRAGLSLCRLRAGGPAAPLSLEEDAAVPPQAALTGVCVPVRVRGSICVCPALQRLGVDLRMR